MSTSEEAPPPPYTESPNSKHSTHRERNGIPPQSRRSMEDEARPLPDGWVRQYDQELNHQFFVDTTKNPPRSIWHHPYDDDSYMSSLTSVERSKIEGIHRVPSEADIEAESTDDEYAPLPKRPAPNSSMAENPTGIHKLGRQLKDKITNSTHPEREARRRKREEEEAAAYRRHQAIRAAMSKAARTGEPQLIGQDRNGKDVYIEPPYSSGMNRAVYPRGGYGYNPYMSGIQGPFGMSPYGGMSSMYGRPNTPYRRPYAGGYGGGMGMPLAMGLGGGMMMGGLMF
ncbi:hypothetical protein SBOR_1127 [Sclerotinia borealis F-4128]|uniref:WW domain-containing protein n=1 Tax=Sclerotinia borealis (strain F-4128) TaxID=1432307 RepID=W9CVA6_SCLBF|nr:hypothetical protein SBOR_1127 [Sclerotinia borealis F-4128]